jgi:hypothetical protein
MGKMSDHLDRVNRKAMVLMVRKFDALKAKIWGRAPSARCPINVVSRLEFLVRDFDKMMEGSKGRFAREVTAARGFKESRNA